MPFIKNNKMFIFIKCFFLHKLRIKKALFQSGRR